MKQRGLLLLLTLAAAAGVAVRVVRDTREAQDEQQEQARRFAASRELPGRGAPALAREGPLLHLALVFTARQGNDQAIVSTQTVPLRANTTFRLDLRFTNLRGRVPLQRDLPSVFGRQFVSLTTNGKYLGAENGTHLVTLDSPDFIHSEVWPGSHSSSSGGRSELAGVLPLIDGQPIARILELKGLALFAMIQSSTKPTEPGPGTFAFWQRAFTATLEQPPIPDPETHPEALRRSPYLEAAAAAYVLGDADLAASCGTLIRAQPAVLTTISGTEPERKRPAARKLIQESYAMSAVVGGIDYDDAEEHLDSFGVRFERDAYPVVRVLAMTKDPGLIEKAAADLVALVERRSSVALGEYIITHPCPNPDATATAAWERAANRFLLNVAPPLRWVLRSPVWLALYHLAIPLLALLFALMPASKKTTPLPAFTGLSLAFLGILSILAVNQFHIYSLLLPVWLYWFMRTLRHHEGTPWFIRFAAFVGLTGSAAAFLTILNIIAGHVALQTLIATHTTFCWLVIGHMVYTKAHADQEPAPVLLAPFLIVLTLFAVLGVF